METGLNMTNQEVSFTEITVAGRILIVEDSPLQARKLQDLLAINNFYSEVAENGNKALAMVNEDLFDLILMDMVLPDTSGLQLISHIKNNYATRSIPIIMLSGTSDKENVISAIKLGASDYLTKPYAQDELILKLELHLKIGRTQRELAVLKEMKEKCFHLLAFDFKSRLNSIWEKTRLLDNKIHDEDSNQLINTLQKDAAITYDYFENLAWWMSIQLNKLEPMPEILSPATLINEAIEQSLPAIMGKNLVISSEVSESLQVKTDYTMISRVIKNVLSNAIKYSPPGKEIRIRGKRYHVNHHEIIEIQIEDQGNGFTDSGTIPNIKIDYIKDRKPGTAGEHGLGIGLAVSDSLMKLLNGSILIESEKSLGSKLTIKLPGMQ